MASAGNRLKEDGHSNLDAAVEDPVRLSELYRSRLLDTPPEEAFDRLTRLASRVLGTPSALVSLVDDRREFFKSAVGLEDDDRERPLSHSYCKHIVASGEPLVANDARKHPLLRDNPAIEDYNAIAYCGIPITTPSGKVLGSFCVVDEKPRRWTAQQLQTLRELAESVVREVDLRFIAVELEESNQALRDSIAMISHDMRNPLGVILGFSDLLVEADDNFSAEERQDTIMTIRAEARRVNRLISDLLAGATGEAHVSVVNRAVVETQAVLAAVRAHFEANNKQISMQESFLSVFVDQDHLERILINLIGNAFKYGKLPVVVDVSVDGDYVAFRVRDHGSGIPHEFRSQLFQRFARADSARSSGIAGHGLGLFIVRGLVELNLGTIAYEDAEPGTAFVVRLPKSLEMQGNPNRVN